MGIFIWIMKQLNIFEQLKEQTRIDTSLETPYRNGLGKLLPWEEPEYLKNIAIETAP